MKNNMKKIKIITAFLFLLIIAALPLTAGQKNRSRPGNLS